MRPVKRALLASTVLLGAGLVSSPAAADTVQLGAGGFFKSAYLDGCADGAPAHPDIALSLGAVPPCAGLDGGTATLIHIAPNLGGLVFGLSRAPDDGDTPLRDGFGADFGMPTDGAGDPLRDLSVYGAYLLEGDGWSLTAGAGASLEGQVEESAGPDRARPESYQLGVNITFGDFAVAGVLEYYNDLVDRNATELDRRIASAGIAYTMDAWTIGARYSRLDQEGDGSAAAEEFQQDRISLTGQYELGPGINIDGAVGYSWFDSDPAGGTADGTEVDGRDALEIGIGTNFTF
jgi:predicted porin